MTMRNEIPPAHVAPRNLQDLEAIDPGWWPEKQLCFQHMQRALAAAAECTEGSPQNQVLMEEHAGLSLADAIRLSAKLHRSPTDPQDRGSFLRAMKLFAEPPIGLRFGIQFHREHWGESMPVWRQKHELFLKHPLIEMHKHALDRKVAVRPRRQYVQTSLPKDADFAYMLEIMMSEGRTNLIDQQTLIQELKHAIAAAGIAWDQPDAHHGKDEEAAGCHLSNAVGVCEQYLNEESMTHVRTLFWNNLGLRVGIQPDMHHWKQWNGKLVVPPAAQRIIDRVLRSAQGAEAEPWKIAQFFQWLISTILRRP